MNVEGFPSHIRYQYKTVGVGEEKKVYRFKIPGRSVAFITTIGNSWYANTYLLWYVDGSLVERVERIIAHVYDPLKYSRDEYILAESMIEWVAVNKNTSSHVFEVLCDGLLYPKKV